MKKIKFWLKIIGLLLFWGVLLPRYVKAQTLNRYVVASAGMNRSTGEPSMPVALNEPASTNSDNAPSPSNRTQPGWLVVTPVRHTETEAWMVRVTPIPMAGLLQIEAKSPLNVQLFDINGLRVLATDLDSGRGVMDLGLLPAGTYLLTLRNLQNDTSKTFKIAKT